MTRAHPFAQFVRILGRGKSFQRGFTELWPPLLDDPRQPHDHEMSLERLAGVWDGTAPDDYADAAITGTLAIALHQLGRAGDAASAQALAEKMWRDRDRDRLAA